MRRKRLATRNAVNALIGQIMAGLAAIIIFTDSGLTYTVLVATAALLWLVTVWFTTSQAWYEGWLELAERLSLGGGDDEDPL